MIRDNLEKKLGLSRPEELRVEILKAIEDGKGLNMEMKKLMLSSIAYDEFISEDLETRIQLMIRTREHSQEGKVVNIGDGLLMEKSTVERDMRVIPG